MINLKIRIKRDFNVKVSASNVKNASISRWLDIFGDQLSTCKQLIIHSTFHQNKNFSPLLQSNFDSTEICWNNVPR